MVRGFRTSTILRPQTPINAIVREELVAVLASLRIALKRASNEPASRITNTCGSLYLSSSLRSARSILIFRTFSGTRRIFRNASSIEGFPNSIFTRERDDVSFWYRFHTRYCVFSFSPANSAALVLHMLSPSRSTTVRNVSRVDSYSGSRTPASM